MGAFRLSWHYAPARLSGRSLTRCRLEHETILEPPRDIPGAPPGSLLERPTQVQDRMGGPVANDLVATVPGNGLQCLQPGRGLAMA
jgi:hypothetical protein